MIVPARMIVKITALVVRLRVHRAR